MKLATYIKDGQDQLAFYHEGLLYDTDVIHPELPSSLNMFLAFWDDSAGIATQIDKSIKEGKIGANYAKQAEDVQLLCPAPFPAGLRFGTPAAGGETTPFYFGNHHAVTGSGEAAVSPVFIPGLAFEAGIAAIVAKTGKNIPAEEAPGYFAGIMLVNNLTSTTPAGRHTGHAAGHTVNKDFCAAMGPYIVSPDEMDEQDAETAEGSTADWPLTVTCTINGQQVAVDAFTHIKSALCAPAASCSNGVQLQAGDILVLPLPLNSNLPALQPGDDITLEAGILGTLQTTIATAEEL